MEYNNTGKMALLIRENDRLDARLGECYKVLDMLIDERNSLTGKVYDYTAESCLVSIESSYLETDYLLKFGAVFFNNDILEEALRIQISRYRRLIDTNKDEIDRFRRRQDARH